MKKISQRMSIALKSSAIIYSLVAGVGLQTASADSDLANRMKDPNQWVVANGNWSQTRFSELTQINSENADKLELAWKFDTGITRGHESGPLIINGVKMSDGKTKDIMVMVTPFPNKVIALDLDDLGVGSDKMAKKVLWSFTPKQNPNTLKVACCDPVSRGVAYSDGAIYMAQLDGHLVKLDAATGKVVWTKDVFLEDPNNSKSKKLPEGYTITGVPLVAKDKILIGHGGGEYGARGFTDCFDKNGKHVWRAWSTGPDAEMKIDPVNTMHLGKPVGAKTGETYDPVKNPNGSWKAVKVTGVDPETNKTVTQDLKDQWKQGGGATWGYYAYCPESNMVYYGTGNPGTWNPALRPGDNKWTAAIIARDLDTGMAKWVYQVTPFDEWDYDGNTDLFLIDQEVDGKMRKTIVHLARNGFVYTLDRMNGMLLAAPALDPIINWADKIVTDPSDPKYGFPANRNPEKSTALAFESNETVKNICPTAKGFKDVPPASYSPKTGYLYLARGQICMDYKPTFVVYHESKPYVGADVKMYAYGGDADHPSSTPDGAKLDRGRFTAFDLKKGEIAWEVSEYWQGWMGTLVTAGNVAFYGTLDGHFKAVDAKEGKVLKDFGPITENGGVIDSGIVGSATTFMHKGVQYVAIFAGIGGWAGLPVSDPILSRPDAPDTGALGVVGMNKDLRKVWGTKPKTGTLFIFKLSEMNKA